ncbi:hypothetical protein ACEPAI_2763 [Sanghuangporus weigelae]
MNEDSSQSSYPSENKLRLLTGTESKRKGRKRMTRMTPKRRRIGTASRTSTTAISRKKRDGSLIGGDPTAPTKKEWEEMQSYACFVVVDDDGEEHKFPKDNYALVLPEGADPKDRLRLRDYWVGKIKEIRSRNRDPTEVWAKVQWLWSVDDLLKLKLNIDPAPFGLMERVLSDHFDFVHTSSFAGLVRVQAYVESDPEPPAINDEMFYYRSTYEIYARAIRSLPTATCFCGEAYNANETAIMHFCPRRGCCRAFHADCLRQSGFVEKPRKDMQYLRAQRALQFERTLSRSSDEEDHDEDQSSIISSSQSSSETLVASIKSQAHPDRHHEIPSELLALARSPMVKGLGTDLPYEWSCVTGNLALVTRARRLIHDALETKNSKLPLKWRTLLEIPGEENTSDDCIDENKSITHKAAHLDAKMPPAATKKRRRRVPRLTLLPKKRQKRADEYDKANESNDGWGWDDDRVPYHERSRPSCLADFSEWTRYKNFVVKDQNDEPVTFQTGGYGLIVHETGKKRPKYLHEYWVGQIKEIRSKGKDPSAVWTKVQWLWSAREVADVTKRIDIKPFGKMERLSSHEWDFVHSSCFQDVAQAVQFDEFSPEPPLITDETFYVRSSFDFNGKSIKPKVKSTCLCDNPYNPDDSLSMHFCPRKKCYEAYHASCLRDRGYVQKPPPLPQSSDHNNTDGPHLQTQTQTLPRTPTNSSHTSQGKQTGRNTVVPRFLQFERTLPDSTLRDSKKAIPPDHLSLFPSSPISPVNASVSQTPPVPKKKQDRLTFTRYRLIPAALLALARSPMVRGDTLETELDEELGCVAGNVAFVTRARQIIERVVLGGEALGEKGEWMKELGLPLHENGGNGDDEGNVKDENVEDSGKPMSEEEMMRWVVPDKGFLCPSCGGVI